MKATPLAIPDVILFEPNVFGDDRGFLFESFNHKVFKGATGLSPPSWGFPYQGKGHRRGDPGTVTSRFMGERRATVS